MGRKARRLRTLKKFFLRRAEKDKQGKHIFQRAVIDIQAIEDAHFVHHIEQAIKEK